MFSFAKASKPARFTHPSDKRDSRNCEDRNAYFLFFPIKVQTYVDKRRLYEAHPFQGQARLTRSWCNGVALCRTSSLQQPFKSSRWLVGRTRNAAAVAPSELSRGNKSVRPRPGAERISGARRSSQDKRQSAFFFFLFPFFLNCSFSCNCQLSWAAHRRAASIRTASLSNFTQSKSHRWSGLRMPLRLGEVALLSFFTGADC